MRIRLAALAAALSFAASAASYQFKDPINVTVTTAATLLTPSTVAWAEVCNTSTSTEMRIGFSTSVTATTGRPLPPGPGSCIVFRLNGSQSLYGIVASGTAAAVVTQALERP